VFITLFFFPFRVRFFFLITLRFLIARLAFITFPALFALSTLLLISPSTSTCSLTSSNTMMFVCDGAAVLGEIVSVVKRTLRTEKKTSKDEVDMKRMTVEW
jgi:hypothetical protein